jgi:hypothetical protein
MHFGSTRGEIAQQLSTGYPRITKVEQAIADAEREVALLEESLARLDQQLADTKREAARKVVEQAQIVAATLTGLYLNPHLLNQEWDVVILDEGSMAPPPAVVVAGNCAKRHFIVIGDPHLLAPVCKFDKIEKLVRFWLGRRCLHAWPLYAWRGGCGSASLRALALPEPHAHRHLRPGA